MAGIYHGVKRTHPQQTKYIISENTYVRFGDSTVCHSKSS